MIKELYKQNFRELVEYSITLYRYQTQIVLNLDLLYPLVPNPHICQHNHRRHHAFVVVYPALEPPDYLNYA